MSDGNEVFVVAPAGLLGAKLGTKHGEWPPKLINLFINEAMAARDLILIRNDGDLETRGSGDECARYCSVRCDVDAELSKCGISPERVRWFSVPASEDEE